MIRALLAATAAVAFAAPSGAGAVEVCRSLDTVVGHQHVVTACVLADYGLDHTTVDPTVGFDCYVGPAETPLCAALGTRDVNVGRTGLEQGSGDVWVAGRELPVKTGG